MSESAEAKADAGGERWLRRAADREVIQSLYNDGLLSRRARALAFEWLRPPPAWWFWIGNALLFAGAALLLAGVFFFFAYNWARLTPFVRFGIVEGALVGTLVAAWWVGLERIGGKVLLLAAALLVGVFLAVFGQVYQTGADAYELFAGWALLITGWVLIGRFGALWLTWLVLLNVGLILYWGQVVEPNRSATSATLFLALAAINFAALVAREVGEARFQFDWLRARWLRLVLWSATLFCLTIPAVVFVTGAGEGGLTYALCLFALLATIAVGVFFFRRFAPDLACLGLAALAACVVFIAFAGRWLIEGGKEFGILALGLLTLAVFGAAAFWLRAVGAEMEREGGARD